MSQNSNPCLSRQVLRTILTVIRYDTGLASTTCWMIQLLGLLGMPSADVFAVGSACLAPSMPQTQPVSLVMPVVEDS